MRKGIEKVLILAVSSALVLLIVSGCQEKTVVKQKGSITKDGKAGKPVITKPKAGKTGSKPTGTLAADNVELKKQLADKDRQIQELKASLDKCLSDKDLLIIDKAKSLDDLGQQAADAFQDSIEMMIKNEELQKQIDALKEPNKPK
jgi:hypothetical protein